MHTQFRVKYNLYGFPARGFPRSCHNAHTSLSNYNMTSIDMELHRLVCTYRICLQLFDGTVRRFGELDENQLFVLGADSFLR